MQLMLDLSTTVGKPSWFILPNTQVGIRGMAFTRSKLSTLPPNQALPFATSPTLSPVGFGNGNEWEIRTYIHINVGK
jgi:hypothetical protein